MYKPDKDAHRKIGLEYEFLAINKETGLAVSREEIKLIWKAWSEKDHVELYVDYGTKQPVGVTYIQKDGRKFIINTDVGVSVVEFAFEPFNSLEECKENMTEIVKEFLDVSKKFDVVLIDTALQPKTPYYFPDLKSEKIWYRISTSLPIFSSGHKLFHNVSAHQVCIDVTFEESISVINTLNAISGITIALFANTGVGECSVQDYHEVREHRWDEAVRELPEESMKMRGIPSKPFKTLRDYFEYNFDIPFAGISREKTLHRVTSSINIGTFLREKKWNTFDVGNVCPGEVETTMRDLNELTMYIWTQCRFKIFFDEQQSLASFFDAYDSHNVDEFAQKNTTKLYVETRNMASQPWEEVMCTPAFMLGLVENISEAQKIVDSKSWEYWIELREKTIEKSLEVDEVIPFAEQLLAIAKQGLEKRGLGEEKYLEPLFTRLEKRESPAMRMRKDFQEKGIEGYIKERIIQL